MENFLLTNPTESSGTNVMFRRTFVAVMMFRWFGTVEMVGNASTLKY